MTIAPEKQPEKVQKMFTRIAGRYDLMNRVMSFGSDLSWRRRMLRKVELKPGQQVLDIGAGTGDLSRMVSRRFAGVQVTAADFTLGMLTAGNEWNGVPRCNADALSLPFADRAFDAVISGFLVRNVINVDQALAEMARVLKPGSRVHILDMTHPRRNALTPFINLYMNRIVPLVGTLIAGQKDAYTYLPDSAQNFLPAEDLAVKMQAAGFKDVRFEILNFGTVAIHHGVLLPA